MKALRTKKLRKNAQIKQQISQKFICLKKACEFLNL